jgi:hypothetical protein
MNSKLRNASSSAHVLARKMSSGMRQDQIEAAKDFYAAFLKRGIGVCSPDPEGLNLGVMIVALASLLANCLDEFCTSTDAPRPWEDQDKVKKEYVM